MKGNFDNKAHFAFSTRFYGPMNRLGHSYFDAERKANLTSFLTAMISSVNIPHLTYLSYVGANLEHGGKAIILDKKPDDENWLPKSDAIITAKKNFIICVGGADCPSLVLYDPIKEVLAVAHCGWKPLTNNIVLNTVGKMIKEFNCDPKSIRAQVGPGACGSCYEVKQDVAWRFPGETKYVDPGGKIFLSLSAAVLHQLTEAGISALNVRIAEECTIHTKVTGDEEYKYYSWRRDGGDPLNTGIMAAFMT